MSEMGFVAVWGTIALAACALTMALLAGVRGVVDLHYWPGRFVGGALALLALFGLWHLPDLYTTLRGVSEYTFPVGADTDAGPSKAPTAD